MKINNLTLINYRRFEHQSFVFNDHFTVLIGDNATGKTQVLQAIVTLLSQYQSKMLRNAENDIEIEEKDVYHESLVFNNQNGHHQLRMEYSYPAIISARINNSVNVSCRKDDATMANVRDGYLASKAEEDLNHIKEGITLPVLAYYGTSRLWNKKNKSKEGIPSRTDGYRWSLDGFVDFNELVSWFMDQELIQLQKGTNDVPLTVMRKALSMMIPGCVNVFYDFEFKTLVLEFNDNPETSMSDHSILFDDLSDGYKMVLTMVFDVVRQMVISNPHLGDDVLEKTDGIILIDELDLSLHPKWQRIVVESLKKTFPLVQFIVSTHSPFIVQSLNSGEVIDLEACDGDVLLEDAMIRDVIISTEFGKNIPSKNIMNLPAQGIAWPGTKGIYEKKSLEDVTEDVMGVEIPQRSARMQKMNDVAEQYYTKLQELKGASSEDLDRLESELDELSAPFSDDIAYHAFLRMERLAALADREEGK